MSYKPSNTSGMSTPSMLENARRMFDASSQFAVKGMSSLGELAEAGEYSANGVKVKARSKNRIQRLQSAGMEAEQMVALLKLYPELDVEKVLNEW